MIRIYFLFLSLVSLIYGLIFLIFPYWFVNFSAAESINIAWLRSIGASIVGLLFFGSISIYRNPKGKLGLLKIMTITSIIQTLALIYSRFYNEFSAKNIHVIDLTIYLAIFVCIIFVFLIYNKKGYFEKIFI